MRADWYEKNHLSPLLQSAVCPSERELVIAEPLWSIVSENGQPPSRFVFLPDEKHQRQSEETLAENELYFRG